MLPLFQFLFALYGRKQRTFSVFQKSYHNLMEMEEKERSLWAFSWSLWQISRLQALGLQLRQGFLFVFVFPVKGTPDATWDYKEIAYKVYSSVLWI